jgi:hypothetical protein
MGYYRDKKVSLGLMPIVIALSVVALIGFAFCIYVNSQVAKADDDAAVTGLKPPAEAAPLARAIHSRV